MNYRQIEYFICLFEERNVTRAARRLSVVQPAVSTRIRNLEAEFGVRLFERTSRGVAPTAAGNAFYELCLPLIRDFVNARQRMLDMTGQVSGELAVGVIPSIAGSVLAATLDEFAAGFPNTFVRVSEAYSRTLVDGVVQGREDFAIVNRLGEAPGLVLRRLVTEELVFVIRADTATEASGSLVDRLRQFKIVLPSRRHGLRPVVDRYLEDEKLGIGPALEVDSLATTLQLVETGRWATILPYTAVRRGVSEGTLSAIPFRGREPVRELVVAHRAQHPLSLAAEHFIGLLARNLKSISTVHTRARRAAKPGRHNKK